MTHAANGPATETIAPCVRVRSVLSTIAQAGGALCATTRERGDPMDVMSIESDRACRTSPARAAAPALAPRRVIVADAEHGARQLLCQDLAALGCRTRVVTHVH